MAYINVAEWSPDMVTDWLKGLHDSMYHYVKSFTNNGVGGKQLLNIRPYELEQLGMHVIGHQEIVLEAVENLKNFNYNLDKENLQFLALHVATAAHSLSKQLEFSDQEKLETAVLKDITRTITHLKALIEWLDRAPFRGQKKFDELRQQCMRFGLEVATVAMRDRFSLMPVQAIRQNAKKLESIGEYIIKDIMDPIILQPASLDLVTLKKRESDLGFLIMQNFHGVHRITEIKFNSPAHNSGKVEEGDEIVQINYQTVVGWEYKKVVQQLQESPPDVLLTLKKRPKHMKIYGQIYIKPYRLPSKKRSLQYRWGESLPSPRATDTFVRQDFSLPLDRVPEKHVPSDTESDGSDILTPTDVKETEKEIRLYLPKPRAVLQRRHTLSSFKDLVGVSSWHEPKGKPLLSSDLQSLRDKSVSFGFGLEMSPRPTTTCLGLVGGGGGGGDGSGTNGAVPAKCSSFGGLKSSLPDIVPQGTEAIVLSAPPPNDLSIVGVRPGGGGSREQGDSDAYKAGVSKVVRFESSSKADQCHVDTKYTCKVDSTVLETFEPIPYVDEDLPTVVNPPTVTERVKRFESFANRTITAAPVAVANGQNSASVGAQGAPGTSKPIPMQRQLAKEPEVAEAINTVVVNREMVKRGRLDKSYSTPAYDDEHSDVPPAIEPRKEHLLKAPPVPPPRPKRTLEPVGGPLPEKPLLTPAAAIASQFPETAPGFVSSLSNTLDSREDSPNKSKLANVIDLKQNRTQPPLPPIAPGTVTPPKPAERTAVPPIPASRPAASTPETKPAAAPPPSEPPTPTSATVPSLIPMSDTSSELLTPNKTKSLTLKKKNSLLSKRRNVSLKTLCVSDIQGHLYRRTKDRSGMSYWAKHYFVLIETTLYGFRSKQSPKANSMIFLSGFTITLAKEVHSRPHAFKVYHPNKTFYFAAETQDALVQWMEYIKQATLKGAAGASSNIGSSSTDHHNARELYSETDSSDDEIGIMESTQNLLCTPSPQQSATSGTGSAPAADSTPTSSKHDRYHLNFGSLKKFTKLGSADAGQGSSGNATSSGTTSEGSKFFGFFSSHRNVEKSNSSELPVPTSKFKSYRKVPGSGGGLQIGTASVPLPTDIGDLLMRREELGLLANSTVCLLYDLILGEVPPPTPPPLPPPPVPPVKFRLQGPPTIIEAAKRLKRTRKRISPYNYIHASNPNLVEFDFQTSKAMDFSVPKIHAGNTWDTGTHSHSNLQSMITLKDLMLQKQAEEAQDMYNKRVCLGVEKLDDRKARMGISTGVTELLASVSAAPPPPQPAIPEEVNKIQRRRLPVTPDYAQSFKLDDADILYTRSKEGQKLRDFGYEMISGDDPFDQRNKPIRSTVGPTGASSGANGATGGNGINGNGASGTSSGGGGGGGGGGGSIKKKTFNWINSERKGSGAGDATAHDAGGSTHAIGSASSSSSLFAGPSEHHRTGGIATTLSLRDSFKRSKNKAVIARLDNIKASSEKLFQFKQSSTSGTVGTSNNNDKESLKTKQLDKPATPGSAVNVNLKHQSQQHSLTPFASIVGGLGGKKNNNELNAALEKHTAMLFQQPATGGTGTNGGATNPGAGVGAFIGGIKKSNTCNSSSDFKENSSKLQNMRKNSAPERGASGGGTGNGGGGGGAGGSSSNGSTSYFTKLSFGSTKTAKEKKLLGSPGLHRAIFGKNHHHHGSDSQPTVIDHEVFSPITYTKAPAAQPMVVEGGSGTSSNSAATTPTGTGAPPVATTSSTAAVLVPSFGPNVPPIPRSSPDYPNMEYPPVFEPETYSLSDPNASLTLLKRRQNHHHHQPHPHHHHHHHHQK
uniref:Connector enhancer of kinase suppressor of ras n=1 Tax=Anopheles christyi TaxID=43041 RepID=A0A182JYG2_9DIPT